MFFLQHVQSRYFAAFLFSFYIASRRRPAIFTANLATPFALPGRRSELRYSTEHTSFKMWGADAAAPTGRLKKCVLAS